MATLIESHSDNMFDNFLHSDPFATPSLASAGFGFEDQDIFSNSFFNFDSEDETFLSGDPTIESEAIAKSLNKPQASHMPGSVPLAGNIDPALRQISQMQYNPAWDASTTPSSAPSYKGNSQLPPSLSTDFKAVPALHSLPHSATEVSPSEASTYSRLSIDTRRASISSSTMSLSSPQTSAPETASAKPKKRAGRRRKLSSQESTVRRESLLERNRRAAEKCRMKKKEQEDHLREEYRALAQKNRTLKDEYQELLQEVAGLRAVYQWETDRELASTDNRSGSSTGSPLTGSPLTDVKIEDGAWAAAAAAAAERRRKPQGIDLDGMELDSDQDMLVDKK